MMKNNKFIVSIFIIFFLLITLTSINAASENETQKTFSDVSTPLKSDLNTGNIEQTSTSTHVLNTSSFKEYVTDGKFNDKVSTGDTIDIQGKLDNPRYALNIDKPVNIISSTGDAYIDLDTISLGTGGDYRNGIFQVTSGSSGTNITGITFHNTRVWVKDTNNVQINNITVLCEQNTGSGVGSFSIRGNSNNISVTNSYFKTIHNGGHSNVVVAGATNCLFENNTVEAWGTEGNVGNTFYLTTYGGSSNTNITIRNNTIRSIMPSPGICWGLVLEGKGHIIENNYINASAAVVPQYADSDYGVVTEIDGIIFRNNYVAYGGPHLTFPGEAYNNTINGPVTLGNIKAYNNALENVTINNTVLFENNTAKKITIIGENNTLNNNEIYSTEDYAIFIDGINNTLINNKLLSNKGYGEESISNSTEYVSINNSERLPRVFYINDDNINEYFDDTSSASNPPIKRTYSIKDDVISDGDILVFDLSPKLITLKGKTTSVVRNVVIKDTFVDGVVWQAYNLKGNISIINSRVIASFSRTGYSMNVINSTIKNYTGYTFGGENYTIINTDYGMFETDPINNTYILSSYKSYSFPKGNPRTIFDENGYIKSYIDVFSKILVVNFDDSDLEIYTSTDTQHPYLNDVYVDKPLNFRAMYDDRGNIASDVHLIEGSEQTLFEGIKFDGNVIFETGNVEFYNCTFNKDLILNQSNIIFDGCTFNGKVTLNSSNNNIFNNNIFKSTDSINIFNSRINTFENNTINTTGEYAIVFDNQSGNNIVRYNTLIATSSYGDYSAVGGDNIVEDNTPSYNTQIIIGADSQYFADETLDIAIKVNDIVNDLLVTKGYVEVYYDGYFIAKKDLVNGQANVTLPSYNIGNYPLKVWYYDGIKYNNNVTLINVNVVKSNVSIFVNEFIAKLNEKATITATFLNSNGNQVMDTNVSFTVGRSTYTVETVDGVATLDELVSREWLDVGKITVSFPATDAYNSNTTTFNMNTSRDDVLVVPEVILDGSNAVIKLSLTDSLGALVSDGRINITTLDGQQLAGGRVSNGVYTASLTLPNNYNSDYVLAKYTGSYYYNDFERQVKLSLMLNSSVSIVTNSPVVGEDLEITGRLADSNGTGISGAELEVSVNGEKVSVTTGDGGEYNYTMTPVLGENVVIVSFAGTIDYYATSANVTVDVLNVSRDIKDLLDQIEELQKENSELRDENADLTGQLNDAGNKINELNRTNNNLTNELSNANDKINTLNKSNAALSEQLAETNNKLETLNNSNKELTQQLGAANAKVDSLTKSNNDLSAQLASTNKKVDDLNNAVERLNRQLADYQKQVSDLNKTVAGKDAEIKELTTKKNTKITVNKVNATKYGENVVVTGKLTDNNGNVLANMPVSVKINGAESKVVTNNNGIYTLTKATTIVGTNNVTVAFTADTRYNGATGKTTFKVNKQNLKIVINSIKSVRFKDNVTITGTLTDANGKVIANTALNLSVNGKVVKVKTGKDGLFTYTATATVMGTNNVTASYAGNARYNKVSAKATFKVTKQDLVLTVDRVFSSIRYKDDMEISGKLVDGNGKAVINTGVTVKLNSKTYKAKTDKKGVYVLQIRATEIGTNNVTVSYAGNAGYNKASAKTTFKVAKQDLIIGFDSVTYSNGKITVKGTFTDRNRHALMNSVARITINGKTGTAKTNTNGTFTYTTAGKKGALKLVLAYPGNERYNAYSKTSTISVS